MATEIKETPILRGKDATRFLQSINNVIPVGEAEAKRIKANYEKIKAIALLAPQ